MKIIFDADFSTEQMERQIKIIKANEGAGCSVVISQKEWAKPTEEVALCPISSYQVQQLADLLSLAGAAIRQEEMEAEERARHEPSKAKAANSILVGEVALTFGDSISRDVRDKIAADVRAALQPKPKPTSTHTLYSHSGYRYYDPRCSCGECERQRREDDPSYGEY